MTGWGEVIDAALGSLGAILALIGTAVTLWTLWVIILLVLERAEYRRILKLTDETRCNRANGDCAALPDDLKFPVHGREF